MPLSKKTIVTDVAPRASIQASLMVALIILSLLVVMSSFIAWLAFNRINVRQDVLLNQSLPTMRFVDSATDAGLDLLDISVSLPRVQSLEELDSMELSASTLIARIESDVRQFNIGHIDPSVILLLELETGKIKDNIRRELSLQRDILNDSLVLQNEMGLLSKKIESLLVEIKLIFSELSLQALDKKEDAAINRQLSSLVELRFQVQRLRFIVTDISYLTASEKIKKIKNDYRLIVIRITNLLLDFDAKYKKGLAIKISNISDVLSAERGVFFLSIKLAEQQEKMKNIQLNSLDSSQNLNDVYGEITDQANAGLDSRARSILDIISVSKTVLVFTVLVSILTVFLFIQFFIRPRLVDRLLRLANNTRAIASSQYDIPIDIDGDDEISSMATSLSYFRDQLLEKEQVQLALADREAALSTILNNTVEGLFTVDLEGVIRTFNPACELIFNANANEVIGHAITSLLPDNSDIFSAHKHRLVAKEGDGYIVTQEREVTACNNEGKKFIARLSVSLLNLSGRQAYSCFLRDVTSEHEARERIEMLIDQLMQSNSDLEQFAYSCSHDLQEPVRMVLSFSELLEKEVGADLDEKSAKYLAFIRQGAKSAKQLIKDMLDYSRLDQSGVVKTWMTIGDLRTQVETMTMVAKEEHKGTVEWNNLDQTLFGVAPQLVQLLTNLVTNGLKYNKSEAKLVSIRCQERDQDCLLCVEDNGIGIDPRYSEKVFEVFKRLVNRREYEGSGIGLSICQKIAEKHGGKIWLESEEGKGSQFFVSLPKETEEQ